MTEETITLLTEETITLLKKLRTFHNGTYAKAIDEAIASAEPKKGKLVHDGLDFPHGVDWVHCSVCGKKAINVPADLTNYCSKCGSKMEIEE